MADAVSVRRFGRFLLTLAMPILVIGVAAVGASADTYIHYASAGESTYYDSMSDTPLPGFNYQYMLVNEFTANSSLTSGTWNSTEVYYITEQEPAYYGANWLCPEGGGTCTEKITGLLCKPLTDTVGPWTDNVATNLSTTQATYDWQNIIYDSASCTPDGVYVASDYVDILKPSAGTPASAKPIVNSGTVVDGVQPLSQIQSQVPFTIVQPSSVPTGVTLGNSRVFNVEPGNPIVQIGYVLDGTQAEFDLQEAHAGGIGVGDTTQPVEIDGVAGTSATVTTGLGILTELCWTTNGVTMILTSNSPNVTPSELMTVANSID